MIHLATIDVVIILAYFGLVLFIGFRTAWRTRKSEEDFLLAGRSLTLPVFIMTLVSTWYGGILGVGEFSYRYGISNWVVQGLPYYVFAAIFAMLLAKKVRATNLFSIPDKLFEAYGRKTAILGSLLTFFLMTPAPYIFMLSIFLQMLFGWSLIVSLVVTGVVAVSYLSVGGFRADVETDVVEFILMFGGFAVILPYCFSVYGGWDFLATTLPPLHLTWHGGHSLQYIFVWFFIALWTLVDPAFHQRCYAARDGKTAQRGILLSIIFWCVFDFMTATAGLYARAALPNMEQPVMAYPMLAEAVLPPIAKGFFYVGMLATIMSTLNTLAFVSAQTLGRDLVLRLRQTDTHHPTDPDLLLPELPARYTQMGLVISFGVSILLAFLVPSVIQLWYTIGTIIIPGLLVPLIASYFDRLTISPRFAFLSMILGWLGSTLWFTAGLMRPDSSYPLGIEPMYPGLFLSIAIWICGRIEKLRTA